MTIDLEETLELIDFHGRTIIGDCCCDDCGAPMRERMLGKLDRMRELIESLPLHVKDDEHEERTMQ
jgi:hypothetical protein